MNDFFGPYFDNYLGPLFGDKDYSPEPPEPGTGTAMNGFFGPYFDNYFGPLFGNMEAEPPIPETDLVKVFGYSKKANGEVSSLPFIVRIRYAASEYSDEIQVRQEDVPVIPNPETGYWEVYLYDTDSMESGSYYGFIFENGRVERKLVPKEIEVSYNVLENA